LTFIGYKQTNKQTNKQTDKPNLFIDEIYSWTKWTGIFRENPLTKIFFPGQRRALQLRLSAVSWCGWSQ